MTQHAEVGRVSPWDDIALRLNPYASDYRRPFAFSAILYPHRYRLALRLAFQGGTDSLDLYGLTTFHVKNIRKARDLS